MGKQTRNQQFGDILFALFDFKKFQVDINRAFTGQSSEKIIEDSKEMDTLQFKLRLAAIIK
jgi:hypothetical protein